MVYFKRTEQASSNQQLPLLNHGAIDYGQPFEEILSDGQVEALIDQGDESLAALKEKDPDSYRMVVYSWG